jgi:ubiquinone/menaquinone biosynthesis C-methylase UbiE
MAVELPTAEDVTLFTTVDRTADPDFYVRFLDAGNALPDIRTAKALMLERLRLRCGDRVLDAGCGTGADVVELAGLVGPAGRVVGVDISDVMIATATRRAAGLGVAADFEVGDAQQLRFDDGTFDACRCERLLMHVPDARQALAELVRVVRPGGRIVVFDFDWDTVVVDSHHRDLTARILRSFSAGLRHDWVGRQLRRWLAESGVVELDVVPHPVVIDRPFAELLWGGHLTRVQQAGTLTADEVATWWNDLSRADEERLFLAGLTAFIVAGTKPPGNRPRTKGRNRRHGAGPDGGVD